jgi:hypothetical protein
MLTESVWTPYTTRGNSNVSAAVAAVALRYMATEPSRFTLATKRAPDDGVTEFTRLQKSETEEGIFFSLIRVGIDETLRLAAALLDYLWGTGKRIHKSRFNLSRERQE